MSDERLLQTIQEALAELEGPHIRAANISYETTLVDTGLDSVALMELIGLVEEKLGIHLPDDRLARIDTMRDLIDTIEETTRESRT